MYTAYSFLGATDKYSPATHPALYDHTKYPDARIGWRWDTTFARWSLGTGPNEPLPGVFSGSGSKTLVYVGIAAAAYYFWKRRR
jgi:hypothetical protein